MKSDVIIVGAGPAGSLTALLLARAGVRVRLLDRARFPRDKMCGDTINPGALAILQRHGLGATVEGGMPVDGMIVSGPSGFCVEGHYGGGVQGRALLRRVFDARLCEAAVRAGAQLEEGVLVQGATLDAASVSGVRVKRGGASAVALRAGLVIVADGAGSRIARELGLSRHPARPRRWAVGGYFDRVEGLTTGGEMHIRSDRYIGVAPMADGLTNACVVTADRALLRDPRALLAATLRSEPMLAPRFTRARLVTRPLCFGPLAVECRVPGMPGLLMAGDAAGFIDPMTGDGLRFAMRGAELAAAAALRALAEGWNDAHLRLASARRAAFAGKWRLNRTLRSLVASRTAVTLADRGVAFAPFVVRHLIRHAADLRAA